jgi:hypothetical protein
VCKTTLYPLVGKGNQGRAGCVMMEEQLDAATSREDGNGAGQKGAREAAAAES